MRLAATFLDNAVPGHAQRNQFSRILYPSVPEPASSTWVDLVIVLLAPKRRAGHAGVHTSRSKGWARGDLRWTNSTIQIRVPSHMHG